MNNNSKHFELDITEREIIPLTPEARKVKDEVLMGGFANGLGTSKKSTTSRVIFILKDVKCIKYFHLANIMEKNEYPVDSKYRQVVECVMRWKVIKLF